MITVNSVSSGKTSSYMAVHYPADVNIFACVCIDYPKAAPKDPVVLKYCLDKLNGNFMASAERVKSLIIMMKLEQRIGKEIIWVRGESFDQVIDKAGCLPTWMRRFCTTDMKIKPLFEYLYFKYGKIQMNIVFRGDEMDRIIRAKESGKSEFQYPHLCNLYGQKRQKLIMADWRDVNFPLQKHWHFQVIKFWNGFPEFEFPLDSNCAGCHHKKPELISQNYKEDPDILEWFSLQEKKKKKYNTWHDDGIPYEKKFLMNFTEKIDFDYPGCSTGFCTD